MPLNINTHEREYYVMDWNGFDECFGNLKTILREMLFADEGDPYKREIYGNYLGFGSEIKIIVQRVEVEIQQSLEISEKLHAYMPGRIMDIAERKDQRTNWLWKAIASSNC